jgi:integrase
MTAQAGQVFRAPAGSWAMRFYDAGGQRRQRNGFRTRGEARTALNEELRRVRLGPLHRPQMTLDELVDAYVAQYDAAPSTVAWMQYNLRASCEVFGSRRIGDLAVHEIAAWRRALPESRRYPAHRALRQVLQAAVRWKWIEDNAAAVVKNPQPPMGEFDPFEDWDEIDAIVAELDDVGGALVVFLAGTGLRPEEAFGAEWRDVDLEGGAVTVRRAFAKGRLKDYPKTARSRRRVPVRTRVIAALRALPRRRGILFPTESGGRVDINNFRHRGWTPALAAAGIAHRRIYDLRHTYATWSLAAGIDVYTLARRMGTSLLMIDRTYGHLARGADDYERELLDAFDAGRSGGNGRYLGAEFEEEETS